MRAWKEDWQNSPPSKVLPAKQSSGSLWELSGSRPFEMFCPHVLPCVTHWPHPQWSQGPEQNVYKFSSPCLPISFISLLPLKATLSSGTRIKRIKETGQEKEQSVFFFLTMVVLHLNRAGYILQPPLGSLPWLWPGVPGCLARASGSLLPLEAHCSCCHNTTASMFGKNTNPTATLAGTKHNTHSHRDRQKQKGNCGRVIFKVPMGTEEDIPGCDGS